MSYFPLCLPYLSVFALLVTYYCSPDGVNTWTEEADTSLKISSVTGRKAVSIPFAIVSQPLRPLHCFSALPEPSLSLWVDSQETGSYAEFSRLLQHTADGNVFKKVTVVRNEVARN